MPGGEAPFLAARIGTALSGKPGPKAMPLPSGPTLAAAGGGSGAPRPTRGCAVTFAQAAMLTTANAAQRQEGDMLPEANLVVALYPGAMETVRGCRAHGVLHS